jgi:CRISPR system Cascade subunit CasD
MLTGLIGNALGYRHSESWLLQALQDRLRFAARLDRPGEKLVDYQTVDLGQASFTDTGWTTSGIREDRKGGAASKGTHIRHQHYLADAAVTVALAVDDAGEGPDLDQIEAALREPARPLFLGRKACLPAAPILAGRLQAASLVVALELLPGPSGRSLFAEWPADETGPEPSRVVSVADLRDWKNQVHVGERQIRQGQVQIREASCG